MWLIGVLPRYGNAKSSNRPFFLDEGAGIDRFGLHVEPFQGRRSFRAGLTRRTGRGEEQPILTVNQRSVKSEQGSRLENSCDFIDATRAFA